jgi:hypothetical protein
LLIKSLRQAGFRIMMGHRQVEQAALFYEFSLEKHVPAGCSRGKLMAIGRVLALDSGLARWWSLSVGGVPPGAAVSGVPPGAAPGFLFAQFAGGAGRWPSYGVIADSWPQPRQADGG